MDTIYTDIFYNALSSFFVSNYGQILIRLIMVSILSIAANIIIYKIFTVVKLFSNIHNNKLSAIADLFGYVGNILISILFF